MASVYDLKPLFQNLLRPLCAGLARAGITANQVTIAAALLSIAEGAAIFVTRGAPWSLLLLPVVLFIRMALNAVDGMLAREFDQKSRLGAILNELGDVVSDTALYLPFAVIPGVNPTWVSLAVVVAVIAEMTGVIAVQIGASRRYDGPMGKSDRALWIGFLALLMAWGGADVARLAYIYFVVLTLLGALTIFTRARSALREIAS